MDLSKIPVSSYVWELLKACVPAILAWWLARHQAKKASALQKKEMNRQLELTKANNLEVQNRSMKLQFCLQELEAKEIMYEKLISDFNAMRQSAERIIGNKPNTGDLMLAARESNAQLHTVMYNTGSLGAVIRAVKPADANNFSLIISELSKTGKDIESASNAFAKGQQSKRVIEKMYDKLQFETFFQQLVVMRNFILNEVTFVFAEMESVGVHK